MGIPVLKIRWSRDRFCVVHAGETSAGGLRSIYPSLGMRQLFGGVTMVQWRHHNGRTGVLVNSIHYLKPQQNRRFRAVSFFWWRRWDNCDTLIIVVFLLLKYAFYRWTRQRIQNTLIVVDQYLQLEGDKTILDSAPPFVAGINLPQQGVVDSNL